MFPAEPVRDAADLLVVASGIAVILLSGELIDRVENDMRVNMLSVRVNTDHSLIPRQMLPCKFLCDFQCQLRGNFTGTEGLDDVIKLHTVRLVPASFDRDHIVTGC